MGLKTDKLFRDKLQRYQRPVPPAAWNSVEKNIRGRRRPFRWMQIAAGILVLIIPAFLLWPDVATENQITEVSSQPIEKTEPVIERVASNYQEIIPDTFDEKIVQYRPSTEMKTVIKLPSPFKIDAQNVIADVTDKKDENPVAPSLPAEDIVDVQVVTREQILVRTSSNTIMYTVDEVQNRFMKNKSIAKTPPVKQTTGQKIAGIATGIKNQEIGLSDLRDLKDDLLTFQFASKHHKSIHTQGK